MSIIYVYLISLLYNIKACLVFVNFFVIVFCCHRRVVPGGYGGHDSRVLSVGAEGAGAHDLGRGRWREEADHGHMRLPLGRGREGFARPSRVSQDVVVGH